MVERVIRSLKDQCVHRHRFETLQHASRVIGDWSTFYNNERPHQALAMKTPAEAYALAVLLEQESLGHNIPSRRLLPRAVMSKAVCRGIFHEAP